MAQLEMLRAERADIADTVYHKKAERRAMALRQCGYACAATSPTTGNLLRGADGRPKVGRRSCNSRWCDDCARIRAVRLADELNDVAQRLLVDENVSDGLLRMITLTGPDPRGVHAGGRAGVGALVAQIRLLLWAWQQLRKAHKEDLRHCFYSLEITYNVQRDSWHPHIHVIVVAPGRIPQTELLRTWQEALGLNLGSELPHRPGLRLDEYHEDCRCAVCESKRGGLHIDARESVKEGIKYCMKGLSGIMQEMRAMGREDRCFEVMDALESRRLLNTCGAFRSVVVEPEAVDVVVEDALLTDEETGEVWATSTKLADAAGRMNDGRMRTTTETVPALLPMAGPPKRAAVLVEEYAQQLVDGRAGDSIVRVCAWSWSWRVVEAARECLYAMHDKPITEEDLQRIDRNTKQRLHRTKQLKWRAKLSRVRRLMSDADALTDAALSTPAGRRLASRWRAQQPRGNHERHDTTGEL